MITSGQPPNKISFEMKNYYKDARNTPSAVAAPLVED